MELGFQGGDFILCSVSAVHNNIIQSSLESFVKVSSLCVGEENTDVLAWLEKFHIL